MDDDGKVSLDTLAGLELLPELGKFLPLEKLSHLALARRSFAGALEPLLLDAFAQNLAGVACGLTGGAGTAWSAEDCNHTLLGLHRNQIRRSGTDGAEMDTFADAIREAACKVLADPRGILRSGFITLVVDHRGSLVERVSLMDKGQSLVEGPTEEGEKASADSLQRSLVDHVQLLDNVLGPVARALTTTADELCEDEMWAKKQGRASAWSKLLNLGRGPTDCSFEQRERIRAVGRGLSFGGLDDHPSVLFIKGWLLHKGGDSDDFPEAVRLLLRAQAGNPLLAQTCGMLIALAKFYMARLHDAAHKKWSLIAAQELVASLCAPAAGADFKHAPAEAALVSEVLGAVSVCLVNLSAVREHSSAVCRLAAELASGPAPYRPDGREQRRNDIVRYAKVVVLAAKLHRMDLPGGTFTWDQMDGMDCMSTDRHKKSTKFPGMVVMHPPGVYWDDFSLAGDDGFMPYEACFEEAVRYDDERYEQLLAAQDAVDESAKAAAKEIVRDLLYKSGPAGRAVGFRRNRAEGSGEVSAPTENAQSSVCQVCGAPAPYRCAKCKTTRYCSLKCSGYDWGAAHKKYFHKK